MVKIYVLELQNGKFYVGKTETPMQRITAHFAGRGSKWTKLHPPVEIVEVFEGDKFDEDKTTIQLMDEHGIDNVRGGTFSRLKLPAHDKLVLDRMINGANDQCFICGGNGHFAKNCELWPCQYCGKTFTTKKGARFHEVAYCKNKPR